MYTYITSDRQILPFSTEIFNKMILNEFASPGFSATILGNRRLWGLDEVRIDWFLGHLGSIADGVEAMEKTGVMRS